ncbi:MAG TPA: Hint domain-containing protein, partial [Rhodopila sp.]|nr:Hint domain-containing protein [Rhodopila sp.]
DATLLLDPGSGTGTLSGFGTQFTNFGTIDFAPSSSWLLETNSNITSTAINGFVQGDTIDVTGFTAVNVGAVGGVTSVTLTNAGGTHAIVNLGAVAGNVTIASGPGIDGTEITTICFCVDTQIATPDGEVPVQTLKAGDTVLTAHNGPRKVTWVGTGKVLATRGKRGVATPVIVRKGALGDNLPHRDLHVTKAHSLYIDDVLIPVEFLVNHRTILWDDHAHEVEIYHVELESHDILIANGAPAESYRDDGNRWLFQNANEGWHLPPQDPYAPVLTGGPIVDAVWRRLLDRAGPHNSLPLTDDPDLHLVIDGERVDALRRTDSTYVFRLPAAPGSVIVASRVSTPSELGITRDPRSLGVALRQVTIRQGARFMLLDADDDRLTTGFHGYEPDDSLRWTDGYAELPIDAFARFDNGAEVTLHLGGATRYPDDGEDAAQAAA